MKNIDHVYAEASKRLGIPVSTIKNAYSYIYKNGFYNKVLDGEDVSFFFPKLGTFRYSYPKVARNIISLIRRIRKWRVSTQYTKEKRERILNDLYTDLRMSLKIRKQLIEESKLYYNGTITRISKDSPRWIKALERNRRSNKKRSEI